jgi:hypothetical protein
MILPASLALFLAVSAAEPLHLPIFRSGQELNPKGHFAAAARSLARYGVSTTADGFRKRGESQDQSISAGTYYIPVEFGTP